MHLKSAPCTRLTTLIWPSPCNGFASRYASGALKNMSVTLQKQGTDLFSKDASQAVEQRTREVDIEEFRYKHASSIIIRAINNLPADARLRRLLHAKERQAKQDSSKPGTSRGSASRRSLSGSGSRWQNAGASAAARLSAAARRTGPPGSHSPPASEGGSSSHSGSTAYYSVASSVSASRGQGGSGGANAPPQPSACFEV